MFLDFHFKNCNSFHYSFLKIQFVSSLVFVSLCVFIIHWFQWEDTARLPIPGILVLSIKMACSFRHSNIPSRHPCWSKTPYFKVYKFSIVLSVSSSSLKFCGFYPSVSQTVGHAPMCGGSQTHALGHEVMCPIVPQYLLERGHTRPQTHSIGGLHGP